MSETEKLNPNQNVANIMVTPKLEEKEKTTPNKENINKNVVTNESNPENQPKNDSKAQNNSNGLAVRSFEESESVTEPKTPSEIADKEFFNKESQKRANLDPSSSDTSKRNGKSFISNIESPKFVLQSIVNEMPTDLKSSLIWINIFAALISLIYLTVISTENTFFYSKQMCYKSVSISLMASIIGQLFSLFGIYRSIILCLILSMIFLLVQAITTLLVNYIHIKSILIEMNGHLLMSIIVMSIIFCLSIASIVLNVLYIRKIRTFRRSQSIEASLKDNKTLLKRI